MKNILISDSKWVMFNKVLFFPTGFGEKDGQGIITDHMQYAAILKGNGNKHITLTTTGFVRNKVSNQRK